MKKGQIYILNRKFRSEYNPKCYIHPFIYWEEKDADFKGIMLTTSSNLIYKNIELKKQHFKPGFRFGKSDEHPKSYIAPLFLLKKIKYEHLIQIGELSEEGEKHIATIIGNLLYTDWETHMKQSLSIPPKLYTFLTRKPIKKM